MIQRIFGSHVVCRYHNCMCMRSENNFRKNYSLQNFGEENFDEFTVTKHFNAYHGKFILQS